MTKFRKIFVNTIAEALALGIAEGATHLATVWAARRWGLTPPEAEDILPKADPGIDVDEPKEDEPDE